MKHKICLINAVGLTPNMLGEQTAHLSALQAEGRSGALDGVVPAVTCSAQATLLTGTLPQEHGIVGNGWYFRETGEIRFWLQSNRLIEREPVYATAKRLAADRDKRFTCAKLFWWFNQGAAVDYSVTPKPHYGADGSKVFGIHGTPDGLAASLEQQLGPFPFHTFWGPLAGLGCSSWIAAAASTVLEQHQPDLTLVYLPHLDYDLQRFGPSDRMVLQRVAEVDDCIGRVLGTANRLGIKTVVVSEYGLVPVQRPVYVNRELRKRGWLQVRDGPFGETLDTFNSRAFGVADHQICHLYVHSIGLDGVRAALLAMPGVEQVLSREESASIGLNHPRAGDLIALADPDSWFSYEYWTDQTRAPDFARTVDIHRKPGYDPCELFIDPSLRFPKLRVAWKLLQKRLGMRYLMDVIPLDGSLVRGSHGLKPRSPGEGPVLLTNLSGPIPTKMVGLKPWLLEQLGLGDQVGL